jgi:hypothetical protein
METAQQDGRRAAPRRTLAISFAVVALVAVVAAIAMIFAGEAVGRSAGAPASGYGAAAAPYATITFTCGTSSTPNCPTAPSDPNQDWIPIPADTPANVLQAFLHSGLYAAVQNSNVTGRGDAQYDLSHPETPVFVRELHAPGGKIMPDIWVIPFDTASGMIGYIVTCNINADHTAIEPAGVSGIGTLRPHGQLAPLSMSAAIQTIQSQSHTTLKPGAQPYLVYAPIDAGLIETGKAVWNAGGAPGAPLWLVPCSDGKDRVVGIDGKVYLPSQIPVVKAS